MFLLCEAIFLEEIKLLAKAYPRGQLRPAQVQPKSSQERPKSGSKVAKSGPRAAKSGPRAGKSGPRAAKSGPRAANRRLNRLHHKGSPKKFPDNPNNPEIQPC